MPRVRAPQPKAARNTVPPAPPGGQPRPQSGRPSIGPSLQSIRSRKADLPQAPPSTPASVKMPSLNSAAEKIPSEAELLAAMMAPNKTFGEKRGSAEALLKHYPTPANVGKVLIQFARKARAREQLLHPLAPDLKLEGLQLALNTLVLGSEADSGPKMRGLLRLLSRPQQNALLMRWKLSLANSAGTSRSAYHALIDKRVVTGKRVALLERIENDLGRGQPLDATGRDTVLALLAHPALMSDQASKFVMSALEAKHVYGQNMHVPGLLERLWQIVQDTVSSVPNGKPAKPILSGPEMDQCAEVLGLKKPAELPLTGRERDQYLAGELQRGLDPIAVRHIYGLGFPFSALIELDLARIKSAQKSLLGRDHISLLVNTLATSPTPVQFAVNLRNERLKGLQNWVERLIHPTTPAIEFWRSGSTPEVWIERAAVEAGLEPPTGNPPTSAQISIFIGILRGHLQKRMELATSTSNGPSSPDADDLRIRQAAAEIAAVEIGIERARAAQAGRLQSSPNDS